MDPRFSGISDSLNGMQCESNFQNPSENGSMLNLHDIVMNGNRAEDRSVNNIGEANFHFSDSPALNTFKSAEDASKISEMSGFFNGMSYSNIHLSTLQNPNICGTSTELLNEYGAEQSFVKLKYGVADFLSIDPPIHMTSTSSLENHIDDPRFNGIPGSLSDVNGSALHHDDRLIYLNRTEHIPVEHNLGESLRFSDPPVHYTSTSRIGGVEDDPSEDLDFSDAVLKYINEILMEEDMEDKVYMLQESLDLQAKEQSLCEALGKTYPPSPKPNSFTDGQDAECRNESVTARQCSMTTSSASYRASPGWINSTPDFDAASFSGRLPARNPSNSSVSSSNSIGNLLEGFLDSPLSPGLTPNGSQSVWNFEKGVEEASKFLSCGSKSSANPFLLPQEEAGEIIEVAGKIENKKGQDFSPTVLTGKKNPHSGDIDPEEERSRKQAAIYTEPILRSEEFDIVLLSSMGEGAAALGEYRETLRAEKSKSLQQNGKLKGSRKNRGKRQSAKKEVVDLRTLLIHCAQAVAADDFRVASEVLKLIRQHSSPYGDGTQRLAHCIADGLEARIAGTGSRIYKALVNKRTSASDFLKAYHLYLASCPFRKISMFTSNKTIMDKTQNCARVHVIDFGILYGFQWPTLIQRLAVRKGGPPKLKITGIEFPQPGFRPAEQLEETGHRLVEYAKMFDVPFEYNAIAKRWETIKADEIKIEDGEFVIVHCMYRFKNLLDETVSVDSSRTIVLNLIREISPNFFIHGVVNGAYSSPFFVTRFREALFHFSALFDMLENNVPKEVPERMLIEKEIFGREALNVVACEGWERIERPETYKQWKVRNLNAGFTQCPFSRELMAKAVKKVTSDYHKDFVIDEDGQWLLLGWKGRVIYAMSCWQPL